MKVQRIIALILVLCLTMTACEEESTESSVTTLPQELGYGYLSEYTTLDMELGFVSEIAATQGIMYAYGYYLGDKSINDDERLYAIDLAHGQSTRLSLPETAAGSSEYIQTIAAAADGSGYWVLSEIYQSIPEDGSATESAVTYSAKRYNMYGELLQTIDMTEAIAMFSYFYPAFAVENSQGELIVASEPSEIIGFGADGSVKYTLTLGENSWIESMAVDGNGKVLVCYYTHSDETSGYTVVKLENGKAVNLELDGVTSNNNLVIYSGDGDSALLSDGVRLYALDASTGQATIRLSWLDTDIDSNNIFTVTEDGNGVISVLLNNVNSDSLFELGTLTQVPTDELPTRTILTLGAVDIPEALQKAVVSFNRQNDTYRIALEDYSTYNTGDNNSLGSDQLDRDIISGNCPDLILLDSDNAARYIAKGVLADMTALMEQDDSINPSDLLSGPLQAYTANGMLYGMPYWFDLQTMLASAELVGDLESWTIAEMTEVINRLDSEIGVMPNINQEFFLKHMVAVNMDQFVNFGASSCNFDNEIFTSLLEAAAKLPMDDAQSADGEGDSNQMVQSGQMLMIIEYVYDDYSAQTLINLYTEENGFVRIGYPSSTGNGAILGVSTGVGISAQSRYMDAAWAFVKTLLEDDVQENVNGFPVTVTAFNALMAEAMQENNVAYIGDTAYTMEPLTQEQVDEFMDYANSADMAGTDDIDILEIVIEEAASYFTGDKTADEVAKLIQNRVTIYLGEIN